MEFTKESIIVLDEHNLRKYQLAILEIAKDVISVMEKYNLKYSLSGGSILGAVRHKGFIPWDDDIDLNITRESYNLFINIFDRELGGKYYLQTPQKNPEIGIMVTQIRKKNTVARRKYDWNLKNCGFSIDLYIVENVFDNVFARFIQKNMSMLMTFAISSIRYCNNKYVIPQELEALECRTVNYPLFKIIWGRVLRIIPLRTWIYWCSYWNAICKNNNSRLVAIPTGRKHFSGEIYERSSICKFRKAQFETEVFNIPIKAEDYLTKFYGKYMEIPPVSKREKHLFLELKY